MEHLGYLYVLANSAMPGVVKVGKTTRSPEERALELSGVTGLPTPFIVVYQQLFQDCSAAESFVHAYLEKSGYRVADNREFFNAPAAVVVKAIALAPGGLENDSIELTFRELESKGASWQPDELDGLSISGDTSTYPWSSVVVKAEAHYYGHGNYLQDYTEAMRLFRQAARLGALSAYGYIGSMYEDGHGVCKNSQQALEVYKEGARKGSVYCYWRMALLFVEEGNYDNSNKCFSLFVKSLPVNIPDSKCFNDFELSSVLGGCVHLVMDGKQFPKQLKPFLAERILDVAEKGAAFINICRSRGNSAREEEYRKALDQLCQIN